VTAGLAPGQRLQTAQVSGPTTDSAASSMSPCFAYLSQVIDVIMQRPSSSSLGTEFRTAWVAGDPSQVCRGSSFERRLASDIPVAQLSPSEVTLLRARKRAGWRHWD